MPVSMGHLNQPQIKPILQIGSILEVLNFGFHAKISGAFYYDAFRFNTGLNLDGY
jgi:hypothetical protein